MAFEISQEEFLRDRAFIYPPQPREDQRTA